MKQFLLFVSLSGAALYALLVFTHHAVTDGESERILVPQTQPNHPVSQQRLSSWESHLPSRSQSQTSQPSAHMPSQQNVADELGRDPNQNWKQKPGAWYQSALSDAKSADSNGSAPVEWTRVVLAGRMHDQASVSSPTVRVYSPGTDLQVVRREGVWLQVSDPVTQEHGWILEKYLASSNGPSFTQAALESTTDPVPSVAAPKKSKKWSRSSKRSKSATRVSKHRSVARWDPWNIRWARRADRQRDSRVFMLGPPFAGR
jgi:hypothetical protein